MFGKNAVFFVFFAVWFSQQGYLMLQELCFLASISRNIWLIFE
jgi:hypothetical protein